MTKRHWQCLQTGDEREIFENRKGKEINDADRENWHETFSRACVDANASDLIDLEADEIVAWKYDVMRLCMKLLRSTVFAEKMIKIQLIETDQWSSSAFILRLMSWHRTHQSLRSVCIWKNTIYAINQIFEITQQRNVILIQLTRHSNRRIFAHRSMSNWWWWEE